MTTLTIFFHVARMQHVANLAHFARTGRYLVDPAAQPAPLVYDAVCVDDIQHAREIRGDGFYDLDREEMGYSSREHLAMMLHDYETRELLEVWILNEKNEPARILSSATDFLSVVQGDDVNGLGTEFPSV